MEGWKNDKNSINLGWKNDKNSLNFGWKNDKIFITYYRNIQKMSIFAIKNQVSYVETKN